VETDVWLTGDGRLLISHDRPGPGATLTLDAVLELCRGRVGVNVELKADRDERQAAELGRRVARRLAERSDPDAYVSSFWWPALTAARDTAPNVRRAFLFSDSPDRAALIASAVSAGLWALHPERTYVTRELVDAAHAAGIRVNVWTVNDQDEIAACAALGVDGIMSNWPERIPKG
jgi:glycerophosphoryl diester phosphodiesterase